MRREKDPFIQSVEKFEAKQKALHAGLSSRKPSLLERLKNKLDDYVLLQEVEHPHTIAAPMSAVRIVTEDDPVADTSNEIFDWAKEDAEDRVVVDASARFITKRALSNLDYEVY